MQGHNRVRVSVACTTCRSKKIKCDGNEPSCDVCMRNGRDCKYNIVQNNRRPPSKRYIHALLSRIEFLEEQCMSTGHSQSIQSAIPQSPSQHIGDSHVIVPDATRLHDLYEHDSFGQDSGDSKEDPEIIGALLGQLSLNDSGQVQYLGSRSNYHLVNQMSGLPAASKSIQKNVRGLQAANKLGLTIQASPELQDHLLELFWRWQNVWHYTIVPHVFLQSLKEGGDYSSPVLLSAMLAIASRFSDRKEVRADPERPETAGDEFSEQAKLLLLYESDTPSICAIQAAVLLATREAAIDKESSGWLYCGMATRMALSMGLHLDCSPWAHLNGITPEEAEVRNVTWWACYHLEKRWSIALGRPSTIDERAMTAPWPSLLPEVEYRRWKMSGPGSHSLDPSDPFSRQVSVMKYNCEIFRIASGPLDIIYAANSSITSVQRLDVVTKTYLALVGFYSKLPSFLGLSLSVSNPSLPHVYNFHLQYYTIIILLHRSVMRVENRTWRMVNNSTTQDNVHRLICRSSASKISEILEALIRHYGLRCAPISVVHCAFTASITHLWEASSSDTKIQRTALAGLDTCIISLIQMSKCWCWSQRAAKAIRQLGNEWGVFRAQTGELTPDFAVRENAECVVPVDVVPDEVRSSGDEESQSVGFEFDGMATYDNDCAVAATDTDFHQPLDADDLLPMWFDCPLSYGSAIQGCDYTFVDSGQYGHNN